MTQDGYQPARVNIGRARGEMTDPVMHEFASRLAEINALADTRPGFVWRLQTEDGDATAVRPYAHASSSSETAMDWCSRSMETPAR